MIPGLLRKLGFLAEWAPFLVWPTGYVLRWGLRHERASVRKAAAEAVWIADDQNSLGAVVHAFALEPHVDLKAYMLHVVQLMSSRT